MFGIHLWTSAVLVFWQTVSYNHNLKRPVSPDSDIKQPCVVHGPLFVQEKVELVSFNLEGDERGGLVSVSVTGHLGQRDCYFAASA